MAPEAVSEHDRIREALLQDQSALRECLAALEPLLARALDSHNSASGPVVAGATVFLAQVRKNLDHEDELAKTAQYARAPSAAHERRLLRAIGDGLETIVSKVTAASWANEMGLFIVRIRREMMAQEKHLHKIAP